MFMSDFSALTLLIEQWEVHGNKNMLAIFNCSHLRDVANSEIEQLNKTVWLVDVQQQQQRPFNGL